MPLAVNFQTRRPLAASNASRSWPTPSNTMPLATAGDVLLVSTGWPSGVAQICLPGVGVEDIELAIGVDRGDVDAPRDHSGRGVDKLPRRMPGEREFASGCWREPRLVGIAAAARRAKAELRPVHWRWRSLRRLRTIARERQGCWGAAARTQPDRAAASPAARRSPSQRRLSQRCASGLPVQMSGKTLVDRVGWQVPALDASRHRLNRVAQRRGSAICGKLSRQLRQPSVRRHTVAPEHTITPQQVVQGQQLSRERAILAVAPSVVWRQWVPMLIRHESLPVA